MFDLEEKVNSERFSSDRVLRMDGKGWCFSIVLSQREGVCPGFCPSSSPTPTDIVSLCFLYGVQALSLYFSEPDAFFFAS